MLAAPSQNLNIFFMNGLSLFKCPIEDLVYNKETELFWCQEAYYTVCYIAAYKLSKKRKTHTCDTITVLSHHTHQQSFRRSDSVNEELLKIPVENSTMVPVMVCIQLF